MEVVALAGDLSQILEPLHPVGLHQALLPVMHRQIVAGVALIATAFLIRAAQVVQDTLRFVTQSQHQ
jgi:hypothetical protein